MAPVGRVQVEERLGRVVAVEKGGPVQDLRSGRRRAGGWRRGSGAASARRRTGRAVAGIVGDALSVDEDRHSSDVWGRFVVIAYTQTGSLSRYEPTFGYGYTLAGTPLVEQPYWDPKTNSWLYGVCEEWSNEIVGKDAGYLTATTPTLVTSGPLTLPASLATYRGGSPESTTWIRIWAPHSSSVNRDRPGGHRRLYRGADRPTQRHDDPSTR